MARHLTLESLVTFNLANLASRDELMSQDIQASTTHYTYLGWSPTIMDPSIPPTEDRQLF